MSPRPVSLPASAMTPSMHRGIAAAALAAVGWGLSPALGSSALASIRPVALFAVKLAGAALALVVISAVSGRLHRLRTVRWRHALPGVVDPGVVFVLGAYGLSRSSATVAALLGSVETVLMVLGAWLVLGDRIDARLRRRIGIATAGVFLVGASGGGSGHASGVVLLLAAGLLTVGTALWSARVVHEVGGLTLATVQHLVGLALGAVIAGVWAFADPTVLASTLTAPPRALALAALSGVVGVALPCWLYFHAIEHVPVSVAEQFLTLTPVFGLGAALVIGERLTTVQGLGALVVVATAGATAMAALKAARSTPARSTPARNAAVPALPAPAPS